MKKLLFPIGILALLAVVSACSSPAGKGRKMAQKHCECFENKDLNLQKKCNDKILDEYNRLRHEYIKSNDRQSLKTMEEAYDSYREHNCSE